MMMQMEERPVDGKRRCRNISQPAGTIIHIASSTDSLSSIAAQYDTSISILRRINKLMNDLIYPQQILYIPNEDFTFTTVSPSNKGHISPSAPRPLSDEELKQIDEECHHKFVKFKTQYLAKDKTMVDGVLLITPDGVMFDPTDSSQSPEFQLVDSIMSVYSVSVYHDRSIEDESHIIAKTSESELESHNDTEFQSAETLNEESFIILNQNKNIDDISNPNLAANKIKTDETNTEKKEHSSNVLSHKETFNDDELFEKVDNIDKMHDSNNQDFDIIDCGQSSNTFDKSNNEHTNLNSTLNDNKNESKDSKHSSFIVDFIPTIKNDDAMIVHLCLKVHKNFEAVHAHSFRGHQNKSHIRHEYWYSLSYDKNIDHMYAFFKRWSPSLTNANDSTEFYFTEIESGSILFEQNHEKYLKDWEIVSLKEHQRLQNILEVKKLPPPTLLNQSQILQPLHIQALSWNMPAMVEGMNWSLSYSTEEHGISLHTMYRKLSNEDLANLIIIEDSNQCVFGATIVGPIKITDHYSGSGESYLFTFQPDFKRFDWTGINSFFVKANKESLCIGASEGNNGLWLNEDLYHGRSQTCQTFDNEPLSATEDFIIKCLEVWTFV